MATPQEFQSMGISIFPSQEREIILGKQPVLTEYGTGVREAVRKLPPEVTKELLSEYRQLSPTLITALEDSIIEREFAIESAEKGANLDIEWLKAGGADRRMDEVGLAGGDTWNTPEP